MEGIRNFRDIATNKVNRDGVKLKENRIYRSATLDKATDKDVGRLIEELGIKTIIDLRGQSEKRPNGLTSHFVDRSIHASPSSMHIVSEERNKFDVDYMSPLKEVVWQSLTLWAKLSKQAAMRYSIQNSHLGQKGLYEANQYFLRYSGKEIKRVFDILADETSYPLVVHCTAGKDRTGLTIALILLLASVSHQHIVQDYARSEKELEPIREFLLREINSLGLHPQFADSPPEAMEKTIEHLNLEYGSIEMYLESIDVSRKQQDQIRRHLLDLDPNTSNSKL